MDLTISTEGVICRAKRAGKQHTLQAAAGGLQVELGQGDGVLDNGRDVRWRGRRVAGAPSWTGHRVLPHVMKGAREEAGHLGAACGVWTPWLPEAPGVAQEGRVPEHIPPTADVHGVSEVTQRRADHVHRELALEAAFLLRARRKALYPR